MDEGILWLLVPLLLMIVILVLRVTVLKGVKQSRRSSVIGIAVTAIIVILYVVWRLLHGGF